MEEEIMNRNTIRLLAVGLVAFLAGCTSPTSSGDSGRNLVSIAVAPAAVTLAINESQKVTVTATYSDNTTAPVTDAVLVSKAPATAAISGQSIVGVAEGITSVTVTKDGKSAQVAVTVSSAVKEVRTLSFTVANLALEVGDQVTPSLTASFTDDSIGPVAGATLVSSDPTVVQVVDGDLKALKAGTDVTITATKDGKQATLSVSVTAPTLKKYLLPSTGGAADIIASGIDNWSSGAGITDSTDGGYTKVIQVVSGKGWTIDAAAIGFNGVGPTGVLAQFSAITFKIKSSTYAKITVAAPGSGTPEVDFSLAAGKPLANGWVQITAPLSAFGTANPLLSQIGLFNKAAGSFLVTDLGMTGTSTAGIDGAVTAAQALHNATDVGNGDGEVPAQAKSDFQAAIDAAQAEATAQATTWNFDTAVAALTALDGATATFKAAIVHAVPLTLAEAPTLPASSVISLYNTSGVYSDNPVNEWNPNWNQSSSISDYTVASSGKVVKKLDLVNYQGIDFSGHPIDASAKHTLHLSYWTANGTGFSFSPISASSGEMAIPVTTPTQGTWADLEIDLSQATTVSLADLMQFKFDKGTKGTGVYFFDNIYLH